MNQALELLGYSEFRGDQQKIIQCVLDQKDVLAILPTGFGKSILYQVPAIMSQTKLCVVISPLIALINDQLQFLTSKSISACRWFGNSDLIDLTPYSIVFVTPESFPKFRTRCNKQINFFAVDECHCINKWGIDFRPSYRTMEIKRYFPTIPILALTATATKSTAADIIDVLQLSSPVRFTASFDRPEISYTTHLLKSKPILPELRLFLKNTPGCGIIYCRTCKEVNAYAKCLKMKAYHAQMPQEQRDEAYESWINNKTRVIVATIAFGMGISKPDVRFVIHTSPPSSLDSFYQESGRAGRDRNPALSVMFYTFNGLKQLRMRCKTREERELAEHVCHFCVTENKRMYLTKYFES